MDTRAKYVLEALEQDGTAYGEECAARLRVLIENGVSSDEAIPNWLVDAALARRRYTHVEMMDRAFAIVKRILETRGIKYEYQLLQKEARSLRFAYLVDGETMTVRIVIEHEPDVCRIDVFPPLKVRKSERAALFDLMERENYTRRFGGMRFDHSDGEVSYQYTYPIGHSMAQDDFEMVYDAVVSSAVYGYRKLRKAMAAYRKEEGVH